MRLPIIPTVCTPSDGADGGGGPVMSAMKIFTLFVAFVLYLALGATVFSAIEGPEELEIKEHLFDTKEWFLAKNPSVNEESLERLLEEVVRASNRGVSVARNVSGESNWSFGQSLFFSSTVITTIGYGHVTPLSQAGKMFCIAYALFGIPLTLVLLSALVERLLLPATALLRALNSSLGHMYTPLTIRIVHLLIIVATLIVVFLVAPASAFAYIEPDWCFLDSFYYCFISLTTIGLGDYIPGDSTGQINRPIYKIATTFYLLTGLTFMVLTLTVFNDIPQLNLSAVFSSTKLFDDPEKMRLSGSGLMAPAYGIGGMEYGASCEQRRSVVHIRTHVDDSPSPEETTPVHAQNPIRAP